MRKNETLITNDKEYAPFLLACSFHGLITFVSSYNQGGVVHWEFQPRDAALLLIHKYDVKLGLNIPEKDLIEATNVFWRKVHDAKAEY